jgi:hypothetical protein
LVSIGIAAHVTVDLVIPKFCRGSFGRPVVLRTPVPEASVEKYRDLRPGEDQIGGTPYVLDRTDVDPVTEAEGVNRRAQRQLGTGVSPTVCPHHGA